MTKACKGAMCYCDAGTVLAAELAASDGGGYGSGEARALVNLLRQSGIFARPLGNVAYLMVTPTTSPATCRKLLNTFMQALQAFDQAST